MKWIAYAALLLVQQEVRDPERWIEQLGSDKVEVRDSAQDHLVEWGVAALPSLQKALASPEKELVARAKYIIGEIERLEKDHQIDLTCRRRLLDVNPPSGRHPQMKDAVFKGVEPSGIEISFLVRRFGKGLNVRTFAINRLLEELTNPRRVGQVDFDVIEIADEANQKLEIERCSVCSPGLVHVDGTAGPIRIRVKGVQYWFSPHEIVFSEPQNGQSKQVGEFTIAVDWPMLLVRSRVPWPKEMLALAGPEFTYELKPGVQRSPVIFGGVGVGGGGGGRYHGPDKYWCCCDDGPKPVRPKAAPELVTELRVVHHADGIHALTQVASIRYPFLRPIAEPFELSCTLTPE